MSKICFILNIGPHYRLPIYKKISEEFDCEFYFGDHIRENIKPLDYTALPKFKGILHNIFIGPFYFQKGSVSKLFSSYKQFVLIGDVYCISTWLILILARLLGKETIAWTHGIYGNENWAKKNLKCLFYHLFSKVLVYSQYSINNFLKSGFKADKFYCIANSLDTDTEIAIRQDLKSTSVYQNHFGNSNPVIIYCGRLQKIKRLDLLLQCIKLLAQEKKLINAILIGKEVEELHLKELSRDLGIDKQVWFFGPCYDDRQLAEFFYNANVCLSPGNVGLTAIHSLSFGCPVVTHNDFSLQMPEFESIKPGITGDFFIKDNLQDMKEKVSLWLESSAVKKTEIRKAAFGEIDKKWNVYYQLNVLRRVLVL